MSKNSDMRDDVIYTWYDLESDRLYLKRNGVREEVPPITRDYIRDLNDQMNALCEYVVKLEQTNIVLDSDNTELRNDARDMQMIVSDNATLRQKLADVTESMGRVEERCAKLRELVARVERARRDLCDAYPDAELLNCEDCPAWSACKGDLMDRMRELGVIQ